MGSRATMWAAGALGCLCLVGAFLARRLTTSTAPTSVGQAAVFRPVTVGQEAESWPSLAPDGKSFSYSNAASGNPDIYVQRIGGHNATNLTSDSAAAFAQIVERLTQTPGVVHAAMISGGIPLSGSMFTTNLRVPGRTIENDDGISMLGLFGLLGLLISAVGIYGVVAYLVSQRTREIGVRMALGATRSTVIGMVLRHACVLVAAGVIIGGIGAWYLSASAKTFLFGLEANDPRAFFAALISLSLAALVASAIPAGRAANVDPIVALRAE